MAPALRAEEEQPAKEEKKDDPKDAYFQGWLLQREAEKLREKGENKEAEEKMVGALRLFRGIQQQWPEWKKEMVKGRLSQTEETLKSWGWKEGETV